MFNRNHTEVTKQLIAEKAMGNTWALGHKVSEEQKAKTSLAKRNKPLSAIHRAALHVPKSLEHRAALSVSHRRRHVPFSSIFHLLVNQARRRNIKLTLTFEEYVEFTKISHCHYCGSVLEWCEHLQGDSHGYNLDRKDNKQGYMKENCVPCCGVCNRAKNRMTYEDFALYLQQVTGYHSGKSAIDS